MNGEIVAAMKKHSPAEFSFNDSCILLGYVGSIAHGTYVPQSDPNAIDDKDLMGVFIPPAPFFLGLKQNEGRQFWEGEWDITLYEIRKYVSLLLKCNPNVLGLLWLDKADFVKITPEGQLLLDNRELFVSKKAYHSFCGYAHSQLKRMTHLAFEGYMGAKRKSLVEKHGYDTKNAGHLIRLLRMGLEFLTEGKLYVKRADSAELIQIKKGEYTLERIQKMADDLFKLIQEAYVRSPLPPEPDHEKANKLLVSIVHNFIGAPVA